MTKEKIKEILYAHREWLYNRPGGVRANLSNTDLQYTDLSGANLRLADLSGANLRGANLYWTDLSGADLRGADLRGADLRGARIEKPEIYIPIVCPNHGSFIGWKKARGKIVKLRITDRAKRSSATTRKCRCSQAEVLAIENADGTDSGLISVHSDYDPDFVYTVGDIVSVGDFDDDRFNECAPGIHFFVTRQEAVEWGE